MQEHDSPRGPTMANLNKTWIHCRFRPDKLPSSRGAWVKAALMLTGFAVAFGAANVPAVAQVGSSAVPLLVAPSPKPSMPSPAASPQPSVHYVIPSLRPIHSSISPRVSSVHVVDRGWQLDTFPEGYKLFISIMPDGNPACASYNGKQCLRGITSADQ